MLVGSYNSLLVLLSLLVAMLASYTALNMADRVAATRGRIAACWLAGGACAMGAGIWSMHFIGMLALSLPIALGYDGPMTLLSLLIAISSSAFALRLVSRQTLPLRRLLCGALVMGAGVAAMHYSGMAAMQMQPGIVYRPGLFLLSLLIAVVASGLALWIAYTLRRKGQRVRALRGSAAVVMGLAIGGMHYTGMAAADFPLGSICGAANGSLDTRWLALTVISATLAVIGIALVTSVLDVRLEVRTAGLAQSLAAANQELTYLAMHDSLTQLPNRVLLEDRMGQAIEQAARAHGRFAVLYLDLDGFKAVNDAFGHLFGDELLVEAARRIRTVCRDADTVARVGGDEFVILIASGEPTDAAALAERQLQALGEPFAVKGHPLALSASIGLALYPDNGRSGQELLAHADAAMYHAKNQGRNGYCFFEPSMNANVQEHMQLLQALRLALPGQQLLLHYQPKFVAPAGPVSGVEALLRWHHPTLGMIMPDRFIPIAEKTGLILPIGEWVLDEACRQVAAWRRDGVSEARVGRSVSVNLSPTQFMHPDLVALVRRVLDKHGLEPAALTLEITESTAMRDADASLKVLQQLHAMGVQISIDDFGTGYSSLMYLKRLPATELKIDRGFVRELVQDSEDAAIVEAIVALGRSLNLRIVAEGVETAEQQRFLTQLGCDALQGYYLARPGAAAADGVLAPAPVPT